MIDGNDMTLRRIRYAQSFYRALRRWRKTIVIMPLGALALVVAVTVIRHKSPQAAQAHFLQVPVTNESDQERKGPSFIRLPQIPGRHDRIAGDFFMRRKDGALTQASMPPNRGLAPVVAAVSADANAIHSSIGDELQLKAIILGQSRHAFINDELVTLGDTVPLDGFTEHEYKVVAINENSVVLMGGAVKTVLWLMTEEK
jgi:hypothetical protein